MEGATLQKSFQISRDTPLSPPMRNFGDRGGGEASWPSSPSLLAFSQAHTHKVGGEIPSSSFLPKSEPDLPSFHLLFSLYSSSMNWVGYFANLKNIQQILLFRQILKPVLSYRYWRFSGVFSYFLSVHFYRKLVQRQSAERIHTRLLSFPPTGESVFIFPLSLFGK